ncbi:MAG: hypothetical protein M1815_000450 [Lichina confinis]|nr:MAG: hypothetical protein M1815_000450 [Lichina confinis]
MALHHPTFLLGVLILLYLSSFVLFALLRIVTGISVQRVGYFSLRRIAYNARDGVKIEIRSLGLLLHRPTFAQPTWMSLVVEGIHLTVDPKTLSRHDADSEARLNGSANGTQEHANRSKSDKSSHRPRRTLDPVPRRSHIWRYLTEIKEKIKRIHRKIDWIKMLDVVINNSTCTVLGIGQLQVGNLTIAVDVRRKVVHRSRLFHRGSSHSKFNRPAEWTFTARSIFFRPTDKDSMEILDQCSLSVHGILPEDLKGLRDATVALKCGRLLIPYDDVMACARQLQGGQVHLDQMCRSSSDEPLTLSDVMDELNLPGRREETIMQAVTDSKEFVASILRGIQEVQVALSFVRMRKEIHDIQPSGSPLFLNASMKEVAMDLHRLDPGTPAHRMYFPSTDISHQALLAGIGFSIDIGGADQALERLAHVPMATATVKTTLPSKTFDGPAETSVDDRNANIVFANVVVTSPSLDLDPKHVPMVLAFVRPKSKPRRQSPRSSHRLISRLLPKASVKFSVHEPVLRVALPTIEPDRKGSDDYDLVIASVSSVSMDVESFHSTADQLHYSLASNLRVATHQLYYQTASRLRYDLLMMDMVDLKIQVNASNGFRTHISGDVQTFSFHLVRPEISDGIGQIVQQLRLDIKPKKVRSHISHRDNNPLRNMPSWLDNFDLKGSNFSVEVAGVDAEISGKTRGVALQLESWSAGYRSQKVETAQSLSPHRRSGRRALRPEDALRGAPRSSVVSRMQDPTDGRRLALHVHELEGFIVDDIDTWEPHAFLSLPRSEVAFSTASDAQGPIFHIHAFVKKMFIDYNLYRYYSIGVAAMVLEKIFLAKSGDRAHAMAEDELSFPDEPATRILDDEDMLSSPQTASELVTLDFRASLLQIKATLPAEPQLMLQIYSLDIGNHRWTSRHFKASLVRLLSRAPKLPGVWARIACLKNPRFDFRNMRRKTGSRMYQERSVDVSADAVRLAVPHQLVIYKIVDSIVNATKATQQLNHRFKTGRNDYVLDRHPQGPKELPKTTFRTRALLIELEDGPFERKLSMIYRLGLAEQNQRLAREEAFHAKARKVEQKGHASRFAARGGASRKPTQMGPFGEFEQRDNPSQEPPAVQLPSDTGKMRYDRDGRCGLSDTATLSTKEALVKLHIHNAQSWKKRIDWGLKFQRNAMKDIRGVFWDADELPEGVEETERILEYPRRPALMATMISEFRLTMDKPSFPLHKCPDFLHRVGKGMPRNMKYAMLIPVSLQLEMGETRMTLRDYPIPLVHIPHIRSTQSPRVPSWSLKTDFVIAEEFRNAESMRHVKVFVVPPSKASTAARPGGFAVDVKRAVSPVKTYSDINVEIHTGYPTVITWATSYQPAIQDMMMVMETFTKPQLDPSERIGFWDKIRLSFHSRIDVSWTGDGDVHLMLKGSRDPYVVTGYGAGFVMCWRGDVRWRIWQDDDPKRFMTVNSGEYMLAIPDHTHHARHSLDAAIKRGDSQSTTSSFKSGALFKKVAMKLTGDVQWLAGLVFERNTSTGGRTFDFIPHYDVVLKSPAYARAPDGEKEYDALRGFRSQHIHLSLAVAAPVSRDWSVSNLEPSSNYNSVHLTPKAFSHFFNWWSLFSGAMSLPVRQGTLWPGVEKSKKKFSRHLATIKYNLLLSPLFISHIYKHKDAEDYQEDLVSATGLKVKLDSFMIDLHQRREEFSTSLKGRRGGMKTSGMRINQAQVDFISADIRAVSASIAGTTAKDLQRASEETLASYQQQAASVDLSRFTIPDNDFSWIDMDDYVELGWMLPAESNPETKIMPLAYAPRLTYFRQTGEGRPAADDKTGSSVFGNESTHICVMSPDNDPRRIQCDIIRSRLAKVEAQMDHHRRSFGEVELRAIRDGLGNEKRRSQHNTLKGHGGILEKQKEHLNVMLQNLLSQLQRDNRDSSQVANGSEKLGKADGSTLETRSETLETGPLAETACDFENRFVVHNAQIKWNNTLRNIILRYIHQVSQRRGFIYYMSRRAVKFILDIIEEQNKRSHERAEKPFTTSSGSKANPASETAAGGDVEDLISQLLHDTRKSVDANDPADSEGVPAPANERSEERLARDLAAQNQYHVRLIAPQIQLQSEKKANAAVLVTAKSIQLRVLQIMDKNRMSDDVGGLVQRRFLADMSSVQIFVTDRDTFSSQMLPLFTANRYGTVSGESWPPWVPLEVMFDFHIDPFGFSRVVERTSASLSYDKFNTLRLKFNDESTKDNSQHARPPTDVENQIDQLAVQFPLIKATCDSVQYHALYHIGLDLLLYSEPLEKVRSERLERIMLASDFSDLRGAPELVMRLQERIRQLEEIKTRFQVNAKYLDRQGWEGRLSIEQDLAGCEDELFFILKAITTSQRRRDDRIDTNGVLKWNLSAIDVAWHLMTGNDEPLAEFQLKEAVYERTDNSDGSNHNVVNISRIQGYNLLPDAVYPEMIAPFSDGSRPSTDLRDQKMLRVHWHMLEAIAGIPVLDAFEVNLFPLRVQLEREVGKRLFEYIFPGSRSGSSASISGSQVVPPSVTTASESSGKSSRTSLDTLGVSESQVGNGSQDSAARSTHGRPLMMRLQPTVMLSEPSRVGGRSEPGSRPLFHPGTTTERHSFRFFQSQHGSRPSSRSRPKKGLRSKRSIEQLRMTPIRPLEAASASPATPHQASSAEAARRFVLRRSSTKDLTEQKNRQSMDELAQMMSRASNYMTLAYVKITSVVLCLSYQGRGERNIEDVHEFVFRMPVIEYRNKTWSNLDLALHLKRDVIKALISHTGALISNKLSHHRPSKQQQSKLREVAYNSTLLSTAEMTSASGGGSLRQPSPGGDGAADGSSTSHNDGADDADDAADQSTLSTRASFASERPDVMPRSGSFASSFWSAATKETGDVGDAALSEVPTGSTAVQGDASEPHGGFIHNALTRHLPHIGSLGRHSKEADSSVPLEDTPADET